MTILPVSSENLVAQTPVSSASQGESFGIEAAPPPTDPHSSKIIAPEIHTIDIADHCEDQSGEQNFSLCLVALFPCSPAIFFQREPEWKETKQQAKLSAQYHRALPGDPGVISLVVPTYNERRNIEEVVKRAERTLSATGQEFELIVVDDNSPDGTADEVRRLQGGRSWLKLEVRKTERDLSTAVLAGWQTARGDVLGCMDADLQHPPEHLAELFERLRTTEADVVIASRYVEGGGVSDWKLRRRILSWSATTLAKFLLSGKLRGVGDPMSGFFILKRSVIEEVPLKPRGYKILLEVLARGRYHRVEEVPYTFEERIRGGSKIGVTQVVRYLRHLVRLWHETD